MMDRKLNKKKSKKSHYGRNQESDDDSEDSEEEEDEDLEYLDDEDSDGEAGDDENIRYSDYFDAPSKKKEVSFAKKNESILKAEVVVPPPQTSYEKMKEKTRLRILEVSLSLSHTL